MKPGSRFSGEDPSSIRTLYEVYIAVVEGSDSGLKLTSHSEQLVECQRQQQSYIGRGKLFQIYPNENRRKVNFGS